MKIWIPLVIYLAVQSITPGPNNLTCLYLGGVYGLRGTRKFLTASMLALSAKAFLCGALNIVLAQIMPSVISWLKWLGAAYMLFMAWNIMKSGWTADEDVEIKKEPASYKGGQDRDLKMQGSVDFPAFLSLRTPKGTSFASRDRCHWCGNPYSLFLPAKSADSHASVRRR